MSEEDKNLSIHVTKMINDNYFKTGFLLEEETLRFFASLDMKFEFLGTPPIDLLLLPSLMRDPWRWWKRIRLLLALLVLEFSLHQESR